MSPSGRGRGKTVLGLLAFVVCPGSMERGDAYRMEQSGSDRLQEWLDAEDLDHSLYIVGQNVKAHFRSDLFERFGQEVGASHPRL